MLRAPVKNVAQVRLRRRSITVSSENHLLSQTSYFPCSRHFITMEVQYTPLTKQTFFIELQLISIIVSRVKIENYLIFILTQIKLSDNHTLHNDIFPCRLHMGIPPKGGGT